MIGANDATEENKSLPEIAAVGSVEVLDGGVGTVTFLGSAVNGEAVLTLTTTESNSSHRGHSNDPVILQSAVPISDAESTTMGVFGTPTTLVQGSGHVLENDPGTTTTRESSSSLKDGKSPNTRPLQVLQTVNSGAGFGSRTISYASMPASEVVTPHQVPLSRALSPMGTPNEHPLVELEPTAGYGGGVGSRAKPKQQRGSISGAGGSFFGIPSGNGNRSYGSSLTAVQFPAPSAQGWGPRSGGVTYSSLPFSNQPENSPNSSIPPGFSFCHGRDGQSFTSHSSPFSGSRSVGAGVSSESGSGGPSGVAGVSQSSFPTTTSPYLHHTLSDWAAMNTLYNRPVERKNEKRPLGSGGANRKPSTQNTKLTLNRRNVQPGSGLFSRNLASAPTNPPSRVQSPSATKPSSPVVSRQPIAFPTSEGISTYKKLPTVAPESHAEDLLPSAPTLPPSLGSSVNNLNVSSSEGTSGGSGAFTSSQSFPAGRTVSPPSNSNTLQSTSSGGKSLQAGVASSPPIEAQMLTVHHQGSNEGDGLGDVSAVTPIELVRSLKRSSTQGRIGSTLDARLKQIDDDKSAEAAGTSETRQKSFSGAKTFMRPASAQPLSIHQLQQIGTTGVSQPSSATLGVLMPPPTSTREVQKSLGFDRVSPRSISPNNNNDSMSSRCGGIVKIRTREEMLGIPSAMEIRREFDALLANEWKIQDELLRNKILGADRVCSSIAGLDDPSRTLQRLHAIRRRSSSADPHRRRTSFSEAKAALLQKELSHEEEQCFNDFKAKNSHRYTANLLSIAHVDRHFFELCDEVGMPVPNAIRAELYDRLQQLVLQHRRALVRKAQFNFENALRRSESETSSLLKEIEERVEAHEIQCELIVDSWDITPEEKQVAHDKLLVLYKERDKLVQETMPALEKEFEREIRRCKKSLVLEKARLMRQVTRCRSGFYDAQNDVRKEGVDEEAHRASVQKLRATSKQSKERGVPDKFLSFVPLRDLVSILKVEADDWRERQRPERVLEARIIAKREAAENGDTKELSRLDQGGVPFSLTQEHPDEVAVLKAQLQEADQVPVISFADFQNFKMRLVGQ